MLQVSVFCNFVETVLATGYGYEYEIQNSLCSLELDKLHSIDPIGWAIHVCSWLATGSVPIKNQSQNNQLNNPQSKRTVYDLVFVHVRCQGTLVRAQTSWA